MKPRSILTAIVACSGLFAGAVCASGQETTRVSVDSAGGQALGPRGISWDGVISADGRYVAFSSDATNLVAGDLNGLTDVFVHDRTTGATVRVSVDSAGGEADGASHPLALSSDGHFVVFASDATNLVTSDTNGCSDVFVHDCVSGATERVSIGAAGAEGNGESDAGAISADGRYVAFSSVANNLVAGDGNSDWDVFVRDRTDGTTELVSVDSAGVPANRFSYGAAISADGRMVAFQSDATNLDPRDLNVASDIYVHDRQTGKTQCVSVDSSGVVGDAGSLFPSISADGRVVGFLSFATNLVPGDTNGVYEAFVHDVASGVTERVCVSSAGEPTDTGTSSVALSSDGRFATFATDADNLVAGDLNHSSDVFVHDRMTGVTERVSVDTTGAEANGPSEVTTGAISADGQCVAFASLATNLVAGDSNGFQDVFVRERGPLRATWWNHGVGFAGTTGIPTITAESGPVLGGSFVVDVGNSAAMYSVGVLFIGTEPMTLHSTWGGDLLVLPMITQLVGLTPWGMSVVGTVPDDAAFCGCVFELQALEADPGALKGVSFTPALKLVAGY